MNSVTIKSRVLSTSRKSTSCMALLVALLAASSVFADVVERYNGSTLTASGSDVGTVFRSSDNGGPTDGCVIKVSGNATHNTAATYSSLSNFTVESATPGTQQTITSTSSGTLFSASGSADRQITMTDLNYKGGAGNLIYDNSSLQLNLNNVTISNFNGYGKSPIAGSNISINNSQNVKISDNTINGDVMQNPVIIKCSKLTIDSSQNIEISGNVTFGEHSSVITCHGIDIINSNNIKFSNNSCASDEEPTRSANSIYSYEDVNIIKSKNVEFSGNTGYVCIDTSSGSNVNISGGSTVVFSENINARAIKAKNVSFSGDGTTATFTGNGSIQSQYPYITVASADIILSDNYSKLSFTGNGNYYFDGGISKSYPYYEDSEPTTTIDQAQVTIAGSNDGRIPARYILQTVAITNGGKLTINYDYILDNTIDDISNSTLGCFFQIDNTSTLELNTTANHTKKMTMFKEDVTWSAITTGELAIQSEGVVTKTGDGTLQILAESEGLVSAESFVISSGRLDYQGYFEGNLIVASENGDSLPEFSPGNSVGTAIVDGSVIINNGIALFEFGEYRDRANSPNHDVLEFADGGSFSAGANSIKLYFENDDLTSWAVKDSEYQIVKLNGFIGQDSEEVDLNELLGNYSLYFDLKGRPDGLYLIGRGEPDFNAIPEPSTWALLILGAAGLMYTRKRK